MWARYAAAIEREVTREDARITADMSDMVTSSNSLHLRDRGLLLSQRPHSRMSERGRWVIPSVLHWSALSLPWEELLRSRGIGVTHVGVNVRARSDQIWCISSSVKTCPRRVEVS